jgi:hypothetical protein
VTDTTDPPVEWLTITPDLALALLQGNDENRNLRARVVNAYSRDMANDRWMMTGETIKIARGGALLDGQHRLTSIIDTGRAQRMLVVRELDPETRNVIDTGAPRTGGDALRLAGVNSSNPEALAAAARMWSLWQGGRLTHMASGMRKDDRVTHSELLEIVTQRPDLADAVAVATRDYERIGIPVGPQAMTRTILADIDAADAEKFFDALAGYATEGQNDPRAVLLYTIRNLRALGQLRKPGQSIGLTFAAWNAWRDRQKITSLSTTDTKGKPLPIPQPL